MAITYIIPGRLPEVSRMKHDVRPMQPLGVEEFDEGLNIQCIGRAHSHLQVICTYSIPI